MNRDNIKHSAEMDEALREHFESSPDAPDELELKFGRPTVAREDVAFLEKMLNEAKAEAGIPVGLLGRKPVTPDELRIEDEALKRQAARQGLTLDTSTVNYDAIAHEVNNHDARRVAGWAPPEAPKEWKCVDRDEDNSGAAYDNYPRRLRVILSCSIENDGRAWLHMSVSHRARIPSWGELAIAKEAFLGDIEAIQILPPKARYVNVHPFCLNLYALLDGASVAPDFTRGTGAI